MGIFIEKQFQCDVTNRVLRILSFILDDRSEHFEYYKKGLGPFIYKYSQDNYKSQSTSQLVVILTICNILVLDGKKRNMKFWLSDCYKEETLNLFKK